MKIRHRTPSRQFLYTVNEIAVLCNVTESDVQSAIDTDNIDASSVFGRTMVTHQALVRYLRKNRIAATKAHYLSNRKPTLVACLVALLSAAGVAYAANLGSFSHVLVPPIKALYKTSNVSGSGDSPKFSPVNSPIEMKRYNDVANDPGSSTTHSVMTLQGVNEVSGGRSFAWPLVVRLDTDHGSGDGVGSQVQVHSRGNGWTAASSTDAYQWGTGTLIGQNIEMRDMNNSNRNSYGLVLQNKGFKSEAGISVQVAPFTPGHPNYLSGMTGSYQVGLKFQDSNSSGQFDTLIEGGPNTTGQRGIWLRGAYSTGLDMGNNDIRMSAGSRLNLEVTDQVALRYNQSLNRIEFVHGTEVIGFLLASNRNIDLSQ